MVGITFMVFITFMGDTARVLRNISNSAQRKEQDKCWEIFLETAAKDF